MSSPFDDFRESLADATIVSVEKPDGKEVLVRLQLWNEEDAELRFTEAQSCEEPLEREIEYLIESERYYELLSWQVAD